jgi:hypothetical protein
LRNREANRCLELRRYYMTRNVTIEVEIREGQLYLRDPDKLPKSGKALLILLNEEKVTPNPENIRSLLGWMHTEIDAVQWQRRIRDEWHRQA